MVSQFREREKTFQKISNNFHTSHWAGRESLIQPEPEELERDTYLEALKKVLKEEGAQAL